MKIKTDIWGLESAKRILQDDGELQPIFIGFAPGKIIYLFGNWGNDSEKNHFLAMVKAVFAVYGVNAYSVFHEAWMAVATGENKDKLLKGEIKPSQLTERTEVLIGMNITRHEGGSIHTVPFEKKDGKVFFLDDLAQDIDSIGGNFAELLAPEGIEVPSEIKYIAKVVLEKFGKIEEIELQ